MQWIKQNQTGIIIGALISLLITININFMLKLVLGGLIGGFVYSQIKSKKVLGKTHGGFPLLIPLIWAGVAGISALGAYFGFKKEEATTSFTEMLLQLPWYAWAVIGFVSLMFLKMAFKGKQQKIIMVGNK